MSVTLTELRQQAKSVLALLALFLLSFSASSLWLWQGSLQRDVVAPTAISVPVSAQPAAVQPAPEIPAAVPSGDTAGFGNLPVEPVLEESLPPTLHDLARDPDPAIRDEALVLLSLLAEEDSP